ncbi:MAG: response regulator transcription factor [Burkholderiales bacterium]
MKRSLSNFAPVFEHPPEHNGAAREERAHGAPTARQSRPIHLTPRELEVLALLCEGLPNKLISRQLRISSATVKCHISRILSELGVSSRLQAVVAAARYGLVHEAGIPADAEEASAAARSVHPGSDSFVPAAA